MNNAVIVFLFSNRLIYNRNRRLYFEICYCLMLLISFVLKYKKRFRVNVRETSFLLYMKLYCFDYMVLIRSICGWIFVHCFAVVYLFVNFHEFFSLENPSFPMLLDAHLVCFFQENND